MESLQRTLAQFRDLFKGMAPSQRLTLAALPLLVVGALAAMMYAGRTPPHDYLLGGKTFSTEELKHAQEALQQAGLTQFVIEGQKIQIPRTDAARYNAALVEGGGVPARFGAEWEKMHEKFSLFASESERREMAEHAKARELTKIICAIPDIEHASVIWERSRARPFGATGRVTATVSVRPRSGRDLRAELARSLRFLVAGAVADLAPDDVTVFNMLTGTAIRELDENNPFNSQFIEQIQQFSAMHQKTIEQALSYIPDVRVAVHVDLENLKTSRVQQRDIGKTSFPVKSVEQTQTDLDSERRPNSEPGVKTNTPRDVRQQASTESSRSLKKTMNTSENVPLTTTISEKEFVGLLPKSVQVTVGIPRDYYRKVAVKQGLKPGDTDADRQAFETRLQPIETETITRVKQIVAKLVPVGSPPDSVNVNTFVGVETNELPSPIPVAERVNDALADWGGPAGLALFALWALWALNRSLKKLPTGPELAAAGGHTPAKAAAPAADEPPREVTKRDQLQGLVKDNPEMAAAVISRWIGPAK